MLIIEPAVTCSKLIIETLEQDVKYVQYVDLIVNFEHILHLFFKVSIVKFEQLNAGWVGLHKVGPNAAHTTLQYLRKYYQDLQKEESFLIKLHIASYPVMIYLF